MITERQQIDEDTSNEHNETKSNNSNIVVKIGASNNNVMLPIKGIDSCEDSQKNTSKTNNIY